MTETRNRTVYQADHTSFGGLVYLTDFITERYRGKANINGSPIARRIAWDQRFDQYCADNGTNRSKALKQERR